MDGNDASITGWFIFGSIQISKECECNEAMQECNCCV
jgi:hypothetical protein